ncbi:sigma-54 interaction domain-containing protein [Brassicibacter mesophilus]|uniref:sigma-54 interaction domain-containing protein n=1 Tax=Brassicibacter mesophilus TaxID=745119 RepID=UPI003D20DEBF
MKLVNIKDYVQDISNNISQILNVDVTVIDCDGTRVAGTGRFELKVGSKIDKKSMYSKVLEMGNHHIMGEKGTNASCRHCSEKIVCEEIFDICCPIKVCNDTIGVIGFVAFNEEEKNIMFNKQNVVLNFAYRMADLVAGKFEEQIRKARLSWNYFHDITFEDIVGCDPSIMKVKEQARKCADTSSNVMLYGESGTGKELFARAIHNCSIRKDNPFVAINCAAIPEGLLESELFGYEEGAFTGARSCGKAGKFELASGGTIFLDEIGDMPVHLQAKLLRVLQERYIERVGGNGVIPVDIRIISATHKDLEELVDSKQFRGDLFYRLNVIPLYIPPIRERQKDIKLLMDYLLKKYNKILLKNKKDFTDEVVDIFKKYNWKGNIREMENAIEYAINMEASDIITMKSIPPKIKSSIGLTKPIDSSFKTLEQLEKEEIEKILKYYGDDSLAVKKCSEILGISIATLYRKIKKYNIEYN